VIDGEDADGRPVRGTPASANSPDVESSEVITEIPWALVQGGQDLRTAFPLTRQERRLAGWPWIDVVRPGFTSASGAGGSASNTGYAFSGSYESGGTYALEIPTHRLSPGMYGFWIIYAPGKAAYMPVTVSR
jgi:hypothetical protein